jgi:hypothetical protein
MFPANKAVDSKKNARDRNVNVNSANARNKAEVAAKNVAAANKADDKPGYLGKKKRRELPPAALLSIDHLNYRRSAFTGLLAIQLSKSKRAKRRLGRAPVLTHENLLVLRGENQKAIKSFDTDYAAFVSEVSRDRPSRFPR